MTVPQAVTKRDNAVTTRGNGAIAAAFSTASAPVVKKLPLPGPAIGARSLSTFSRSHIAFANGVTQISIVSKFVVVQSPLRRLGVAMKVCI